MLSQVMKLHRMMVDLQNIIIRTLYSPHHHIHTLHTFGPHRCVLTFHPGLIKGEPSHKEGGLEHVQSNDADSTVDTE